MSKKCPITRPIAARTGLANAQVKAGLSEISATTFAHLGGAR